MTILENLPCSTGGTSGTSPSSPGPTRRRRRSWPPRILISDCP